MGTPCPCPTPCPCATLCPWITPQPCYWEPPIPGIISIPGTPPPFLGVPSSRESFLSLGPSLSLWSPIAGTIPCLRDPPPSLGQSHTLGSALSLGPSLSLEPLLCPWDHPCSWNLLHPWDPPFLEPSLSLGTFYPWNSIVSRTIPVPQSPFYPWNHPHSWTPLILAPHHPHPLPTTPIPNLLFSPPLQTLS